MNRRSIRFRLTAWYAAILALTFAVGGAGVWLAVRDSINDTVDKELRSRVGAMRDFLQRHADSDRPLKDLMESTAIAPAGTRFRIADRNGAWLYQSPATRQWAAAAPDPSKLPKRGSMETVTLNGKPFRILTAAIPSGAIQIGLPLDEFREMLDAFTWTAILASPILLLLASAGGFWMSRRALAPVEWIARTAGEIEAQNLSKRLPIRATGDELDRLSATLNAMFGRLEKSFQRMTQFTADASHELRTPVAIIRTTAEVTRRRPRTSKEYADALDRILAESVRTTELIEDLMLLARADANLEELVREPVALNDVVQSAFTDALVLAEAADIQVTVGRLDACTVSGDYRALRRLILILLDNAIKYSRPQGKVRLQLVCERQAGRPVALVEVEDSGIGISAADLPHVFERFFRASKDRSRTVDGVGLGLPIARAIAQRHGGEVSLESELGVGSLARVMLPVV